MYYPILRGRQNELLAIRELLKSGLLSPKIIPVVEPVKLSATLTSTVDEFWSADHSLVLIRNPKDGAYSSDTKNSKNTKYNDRLADTLAKAPSSIKHGLYVDEFTPKQIEVYKSRGIRPEDVIAICVNPDQIKYYETAFADYKVKTMVPYAPAFRRIRGEKILTENKFNKKTRNVEYKDPDDEFFSDDHLYHDDGYIGFSDYSIIGDEYSESGFAPYAVAIHIVYFDSDGILRVHHFVSDDNDDISDPAGKFYQALTKLHAWNEGQKRDTVAMQQFERIYEEQSYPGLGVIKKLSIMHHLELMSRFLDEGHL